MPRLVFALVALATLLAGPVRATDFVWTWASPAPQGNDLAAVAFESASIGYAAGERGTMLRTVDGGQSWTVRTQAPTLVPDLNDLLVLGAGELLAVGSSPGIFRSHDGGATWLAIANPSTQPLWDVTVLPTGDVSAVGDSGQVLRSADGGDTWTRMPTVVGNRRLRFQAWKDAMNAVTGGDRVLRRTVDGGQTWTPLPNPGIAESEFWNDGFWLDDQNAELVADFHTLRTGDGGGSWASEFVGNEQVYQSKTLRLSPTHWFRAIHIEGAQIIESVDGGIEWNAVFQDFSVGGVFDLTALDDGTLMAVGSQGALIRSTDGGANWARIETCACTSPRPHISQVVALPFGRAVAGTTQPGVSARAFLMSEDAGRTWTPNPNGPATFFLNSMTFPTAQVGYAGGGTVSANVWRTADGGASWTSIPLTTPPFANSQVLRFAPLDALTTWAVVFGSGGSTMYRTVDGGLTWLPRTGNLPSGSAFLRCAFFLDGQTGWAGGGSGSTPTLWKTTNAGATWTAVATSGLPAFIGDLYFRDALNGLAALWSGGGVYRTTNGGATWTQVSNVLAREFRFLDALHGWASTATGGVALRTADGGATWETIPLPTTFAANAVAPFAGGVLIGGDGCTLLRGEELDAVSVERSVAVTDRIRLRAMSRAGSAFELSFALPVAGEAEVAIFDLQGRTVARVARGSYAAGVEHRVRWEGRGDRGDRLAIGTYFVRVRSGRQTAAVAVSLLR